MSDIKRWYPGNARPNPTVRVEFSDSSLDLTGVTMSIFSAKNPTVKPFNGDLTSIVTGTLIEGGVYAEGLYDVTASDTIIGRYNILCDITINGETETVPIDVWVVSND